MTKLNLTAKGRAQELILAYLQENASDVLAEKINNGVIIEKDGKHLISKKDLDGFMAFANSEAKKLAEKGANSACVEDSVVYGWAIHFFEESSLEGKLYNEDGSEYKAVIKPSPKTTSVPTPKKKENPQMSLFNLLNMGKTIPMSEDEPDKNDEEADIEVDEETGEIIKTVQANDHEQVEHVKPFYARYLEIKEEYKDYLLFQRLGDFYEVFADDAKAASEALDLTLTGRDVGLKERVAMAGIPYHAADVYFTKLVQTGFTVAMIEGDEVKTYPDKDTDEEEISQEEMRQFDGDIDPDVPTVSRIVNELQKQTTNLGEKADDIKRAGEILQSFEDMPEEEEPLDEEHLRTSFDKETMLYLYELFEGKMDII